MAIQKTLSIIKPDATAKNLTGAINTRFEQNGLRIIAQKRVLLTKNQAQKFYAEHSDKAFFENLCDYMTSGPVVLQVLCGEDAIAKNRQIMGATNPANAEVGTIRRDFGESIEHNVVHGSDSEESAAREVAFFFSQIEICE